MIVEPAPAKLNLALHVRRRRADGYHDLETLFAFCAHGDEITVETAETNRLKITGPFASALFPSPLQGRGWPTPDLIRGRSGEGQWDTDNLVVKAATAFTKTLAIPHHHTITLTKNLPIASGIGGGSADAAATLRALARLHAFDVPSQQLHDIAATLGADVPACLLGTAAHGSGKGDSLMPIAGLGDMPALLINPNVAVSTAAVFARWDGTDHGPLPEGDALTIARHGRNDLQPPACALAPAINEVLSALEATGCILARMSGSGATCFALFDRPEDRDRADQAIARSHPDWWRLATTVA